MGTRHLVCVVEGGDYKVAQYGQWDGYPEGQGSAVLDFLAEPGSLEKLRSVMPRVRFLDPEGADRAFLEEYDKNAPEWSNDPDNRTDEQKRWFDTFMTRDLGAKILTSLANAEDAEILLKNNINFAGESLFCEWAYVVDLDANIFEVYKGFNKDKLDSGERFSHLRPDDQDGYEPVKLVVTFALDDLPDKDSFVAVFDAEDE